MHQHIAGHEATLGCHLLAAPDLDHLFGGHQHFVNLVFKFLLGHGCADLLGDLLFEVRQDTDRIPPFCHLNSGPCLAMRATPACKFVNHTEPRPRNI